MKPLRAIWAWAQHNPVRTSGIAAVLLGWAAAAHIPDTVVGGLGTLLALFLGTAVHNAVTPVTSAVEAVKTAAAQASLEVAERLDAKTAGAIGELTSTATGVVAESAIVAADSALRDLGVKRKERMVS